MMRFTRRFFGGLFVAGVLLATLAGPRHLRAADEPAVHAASEPAPEGIVSGGTAGKLIAWTDYHDAMDSGAKTTWSWRVTGYEYSVDGKTYGKPPAGTAPSTQLSDAAAATTEMTFSAPAGYWRVGYHATATRTDAGGVVTTQTSKDKVVEVIVVTATITVWDDRLDEGRGDWGATAEIAAGGIDSRVHQTDVFVTVTPAVAAVVPVTLQGGKGDKVDASLRIDGRTIGPGQTAWARTDAGGHVIGMLTSSDAHEVKPVSLTGAGGSAAVNFGWDNYTGKDKWYQSPNYFRAGDTSDLAVKFEFNGRPLDGHKILFVVGKVEYTDKDGKAQTLLNTPEHPQDLADWAAFDEPEDPTDGTGTIYSKVHYKQKCVSATNVVLTVYDMTVYAP